MSENLRFLPYLKELIDNPLNIFVFQTKTSRCWIIFIFVQLLRLTYQKTSFSFEPIFFGICVSDAGDCVTVDGARLTENIEQKQDSKNPEKVGTVRF